MQIAFPQLGFFLPWEGGSEGCFPFQVPRILSLRNCDRAGLYLDYIVDNVEIKIVEQHYNNGEYVEFEPNEYGEEYYEGENLTQAQFFEFLKDKNTTLSTCQPSVETVKEAWREVLKEYT